MAVRAYYIPNGPKNLETIFPAVDFSQVSRYYVEVKDSENVVVATTTINEVGGCCDDDKFRIIFFNSAGAIGDGINFKRITIEHEVKSETFQSPLTYPLDKTIHGNGRFNVKSNDKLVGITTEYFEEHQEWIDELFDSPLAWVQWEGTQGQPDSFLPIVITDVARDKVKKDERYVYEVRIEFRYSHDNISIRN